MKAVILTVGDELLIGQVVDTNSAWIGSQLYDAGIEILYSESLRDQKDQIESALRRARARADVILMTGGLGPTKDDITKEVLCQVMDCGLYFSDATYNRIQRVFSKRGIPLKDAHRDQCMLPEKAEVLTNARGTAPGMLFNWEGVMVVSMPGVPMEMKYLMTHEVLPRLGGRSSIGQAKRTIRTVGIPESSLAELVEPCLQGSKASIAYLPSRGQVRLRISRQEAGESVQALQKEVDAVVAQVVDVIGDAVYGFDDDGLEAVVGRQLSERGLKMCTAESCTGGYLAHRLTSVPGSSNYYVGSIIAYANSVKEQQLGVSRDTLETYGAVSIQVTEEMLSGALKNLHADVGIAVSGIAGPGGGTKEKPVGTICITVGSAERCTSRRILVGKDRENNIRYSAVKGLNMLRKFLLDL